MINTLVAKDILQRVLQAPEKNHWPQSPLERVSSARVLLHGPGFALAETVFFAPQLIRYASWRTEHIGGTYRQHFWVCDNIKMYYKMVIWFYDDIFPACYEKEDFEHKDYTLLVCSQKTKAFVNLRQYPDRSYLLDLVNAAIQIYDSDGRIVATDGTDSIMGDADTALPLEQRTKTIDQLAKQNRMRESKIVIQKGGCEFEGRYEEDLMTFANFENLLALESSEVEQSLIQKIRGAELGERALQKILHSFKSLLEECGISYRK